MRNAIVLLVASLISFIALTRALDAAPSNDDSVQVNLYIMSQCPDVKSFMNAILNPLMASLGSIIDLHVDFVAKEDPNAKYGFSSMHGDSEVLGDLLEGCLQDMVASSQQLNQTNFYNTLSCGTANYGRLLDYLPLCARNFIEPYIRYDDVKACSLNSKGKALMKSSVMRTAMMKVRNSPTIYIGGEMICEWHGETCHMQRLEEYQKLVCSLKQGSKPEICSQF